MRWWATASMTRRLTALAQAEDFLQLVLGFLIAIGTGADVAMEASDVTLVSGDPNGIATAIQLSRRPTS